MTVLQGLTNFIDRHLKEIRFFSFGLGAVGIALIGRSFYVPKYRTIQEIESRFLRDHLKLKGLVVSVTDKGTLQVDHLPVLALRPRTGKVAAGGVNNHLLPVTIACTKLHSNGMIWLRENLSQRKISFNVVHVRDGTELTSVVRFKPTWFSRLICVNEEVVRRGLGYVEDIDGLKNNSYYEKLLTRLLKAEVLAEKKGKGMWERPSLTQRMMEQYRNASERIISKLKFLNGKERLKRKS